MSANESIEEWIVRVQHHEHDRALARLQSGDDIESIMLEMANRITNKLHHPIMIALNNPPRDNYEP